ncbi:TMEM175 family protein [Thioalkalivibrio paradoxus]|uniref:Membrane protein n=1 Tax=Thioalkalivibrio paradoxus ARh 1 TaxID=713585 RepID=W0DMT2_9GAMM|nr:TMEM175 family protein [Thioalkalivibrio paradoxus]AHE98298.1 membrane protein [Thioalkalivibrio paradoxus ARh 1]
MFGWLRGSGQGAAQERFSPAPHRLEALSDGVFAIVLTLLALELRLPDAAHDARFTDVIAGNAALIGSYAVSFFIVGLLWKLHHMVLERIGRGVAGIHVLNLAFLATVTLTPWSLGNLTSFPGDAVAVATFSGLLLAAWLILIAILTSALAGQGHDEAQRLRIRQLRVSLSSGPLVAAASIAIAPFSTDAALYVWLALIPLSALRRRFAR